MRKIEVNEYLFKKYGAYAVYICMKFKEPLTIMANLGDVEKELLDFDLSPTSFKKLLDRMIKDKVLNVLDVKRVSYTKFITLQIDEQFLK